MTGVGIGRFANRKSSKVAKESPSEATTDKISGPGVSVMDVSVDQSENESVWEGAGEGAIGNNDQMGDDFSIFGGRDDLSMKDAFMDDMIYEKAPLSVGQEEASSASSRPTQSTKFGFSRFANKNKTPTTDANKKKNYNQTRSNEDKVTNHKMVVTPDHDGNNDVVMDDSVGIGSDENANANGNINAITTNRSGTQNTNTPPPRASTTSASLSRTDNTSPAAMELEYTSYQNTEKECEKPRRVSLEESSSFPEGPFLSSKAGDKQRALDKTKQHLNNDHLRRTLRPAFGGNLPNIIPGSRARNDHPRILDGDLATAKGFEGSFPQQQKQQQLEQRQQNADKGKLNGEQHLRPERFANVTDNRRMRQKAPDLAVLTPNPPNPKDSRIQNPNINLSSLPPTVFPNKENGQEMRRKSVNPNTTIEMTNSLEPITNIRKTNDRQREASNGGDNSDNFETDEVKFLTNIRDTEDLQVRIEMDLLDMNDRFAEHYSFLLRDLDLAVDLLDKLEDIEELANETLVSHQNPGGAPKDVKRALRT